ncbi:ParA family protein [Teredinibacter sp. KSP-S5-2]|uniref:ParA family protein n=1 Tax=Teredinibacter sp. KSP-S5-2 TaxID=3034506 RepID=UPI002934C7AA|nr:ParA family protein [Teredinibacter sp. KSP-S5-2]WNO07886.1 ParA family protein [Teredinibacter sp. KSP-S5-2]
MITWTVANQKGGVGKTTTTVALGGLATEQGKRVLLVDMDPHGSLTCYFRLNPENIEASVFTLFEQRSQLSEALVGQILTPTPYANLCLLPASMALATLERKAIGDGMGLVLLNTLAQIKDSFDLVIIDCPPQLGVLMINALAACNQLLIPVQTEFLALKGLDRMLHTLTMLGKSRKQELKYCVVPTMFDRRTQASVSSLRTLRNDYSNVVWPGKIPVDTKLRDASKAGVPPNLFDPEGRAMEAYKSLYKYMQE